MTMRSRRPRSRRFSAFTQGLTTATVRQDDRLRPEEGQGGLAVDFKTTSHADEPTPKRWYWVRHPSGDTTPHVLNRTYQDANGRKMAEFYVGSMLKSWPASCIVAEAKTPCGDSA